MGRTPRSQSDHSPAQPAAERSSRPSATVVFLDNRPEAIAQRELQGGIEQGPRVFAQRRLITQMQHGPKSVAQRMQFRSMFGGVAGQPLNRAAPPSVVQRQKDLKKDDPVWLLDEGDVRYEGRVDKVVDENTYVVDVVGKGPITSHERYVEYRKEGVRPEAVAQEPKALGIEDKPDRPLFRFDRKGQVQHLAAIDRARIILRQIGQSKASPENDAAFLGQLWDELAGIPFKFGRANLEAAFPDNKLARFITKMGFANLVRELRAPDGVKAMTHSGQLAMLKAEIVGELWPILDVFRIYQMNTSYFDESGESISDYGRLEASVRERQIEIQRIKSAGMSEQEIGHLKEEIEHSYASTDEARNKLSKEERFIRQDIEADQRQASNRLLSTDEVSQIADDTERDFQNYRLKIEKVPLEDKKAQYEAFKEQLKVTTGDVDESSRIRTEMRNLKRDIEATEAFGKSALRADAADLWAEIERLTLAIESRKSPATKINERLREQPPKLELESLKKELGKIATDNKKDQAAIDALKKKHVTIDIEFEAFRLKGSKVNLSEKEHALDAVRQKIGPVEQRHKYLSGVRKSGLDSTSVLEANLIDARKRGEEAKVLIRKSADEKTATQSETIRKLMPDLHVLLQKRLPLIEQALAKDTLPDVRDTGEKDPLKLAYTRWFVYRKAAVEKHLIEPKDGADEKIAADYRKIGQAQSALEDIPKRVKKELEAAETEARSPEDKLVLVRKFQSREKELPDLEHALQPDAELLSSMTRAQSAASSVTLTKLQEYQEDFERRKIQDLLREFDAEITAASKTPEQLLVLSNFSGFLGERSSGALLERIDKVLPGGFRGALKDLRNRAIHLFDTHGFDILNDSTIASAVQSAAQALHVQLIELDSQGAFLAGKTTEFPLRSSSSEQVFLAINKAAQALPRIQLDFDISGGPKPPEKAGQASIFKTAIDSAPPVMQEIAELISSGKKSGIDGVVELFDERLQGSIGPEDRKRQQLIESRLQALGQAIGNLQQLDETLPALASLGLKVGQNPGFELLQQFIAAIKEFRSARTHGGFTNVPALQTTLRCITEQPQQIKAALFGLKELVARSNIFT